MSLMQRLFLALLLCSALAVGLADNEQIKAAVKAHAAQLVAQKEYKPKTKDAALQGVASKLRGISRTGPKTTSSQNQPEMYANLSPNQLKEVKRIYDKMNEISMQISRSIRFLERPTAKKGRRNVDSESMLNSALGKLEKLRPQLRAVESWFPPASELLLTTKQLQKTVEAVFDDEKRVAESEKAKVALETKIKAKAATVKRRARVSGSQCTSGSCCTALFKFQPEGYGCAANECVESMKCLGNSGECPMGVPKEDGTACKKGRCLSGVCVHEDKLSAGCSAGPCCNVAEGKVKELGTPCDISPDACVEPAALCGGDSAECRTVNKPDGALCRISGAAGTCSLGVCVEMEIADGEENEEDQVGEGRKRLAELAEKQRLKEQKRRHNFNELKHLVRRFGVLLWMNTKLDNMSADRVARQYAATALGTNTGSLSKVLSGTQTSKTGNKLTPESVPNKLWDTYLKHAESSSSATATAATATAAVSAGNLQSSLSNTTGSSIGFVLIGVGIILIVAYFIFGGKKAKKEPQVIY